MEPPPRILVVDDNRKDNERYCQVLHGAGYEVQGALDGDRALQMLREQQFDVVVLDMMLPFHSQVGQDIGGIELLRRIHERDSTIQVIAITGYGDRELAILAMAQGARDFVVKDLETDERLPGSVFVAVVRSQLLRAAGRERTNENSGSLLAAPPHLVANSEAMRKTLRRAFSLAATDIPLLIIGEPGVGKELLAKAIHVKSRHAAGELVIVPCTNLSPTMIELWGDVSDPETGLCTRTEGGTLVLKEVQALSLKQQQQFDNLVSRREYFPVGAVKAVNRNVRVIATASNDLKKMVEVGRFWHNLYDALSIAEEIAVPPLRERGDIDTMAIAGYLLSNMGLSLTSDAAELLAKHDYAGGNINELEKVLKHAAVHASAGVIHHEYIRQALLDMASDLAQPGQPDQPAHTSISGTTSERADRIATLSEQIKEWQRRLDQRRLQAAKFGINTPPEISLEIEDIERTITELKRQAQELTC